MSAPAQLRRGYDLGRSGYLTHAQSLYQVSEFYLDAAPPINGAGCEALMLDWNFCLYYKALCAVGACFMIARWHISVDVSMAGLNVGAKVCRTKRG